MKFRILKDKALRNHYFKNELSTICYKFLISNFKLKQNSIFFFNLINFNFFHLFLSKNSRNKIHNYCIITGRGRGILTFFRLSRITFRNFVGKGLLAGIKRAI